MSLKVLAFGSILRAGRSETKDRGSTMSTIEISLPGTNEWKKAIVICRDAKGFFVGNAGALGSVGTLVLVRFWSKGEEIRLVVRHAQVLGRYEALSELPAAARPAMQSARSTARKSAA